MTSRRRFAAGFAALLALTGALVFGGAIAANADDGLEITTSTLTWSTAPITIQGVADADNQEPIEIREGTDPGGAVICAAAWSPAWSCTATLPVGSHEMTARQAPDAINEGDARADTVTIQVTYPDPDVTSGDPLFVTAGDSVNVTGLATYPNVTVRVTTSSPVGDCEVAVPVASVGDPWSCSLTADASASGDFDLSVEQLVGGNPIGDPWVGTLHIDAAPISIFSPANGSDIVWTGSPTTITGYTSDPGLAPVEVYDDGSGLPLCTDPAPSTAPGDNGFWGCTPGDVFAPGTYSITAYQYIFSATSQFDVLIPRPTLESGMDPYNVAYDPASGDVWFSGYTTYSAGQIVVEMDGTPGAFCTSPAIPSGPFMFWACGIDIWGDVAPGGSYTFSYWQEDGTLPRESAGSLTLNVGPLPPAAPVIEDPEDGDVLAPGSGNWLTISGLGDPSALLDVEIDGDVVCPGLTVVWDTTWSCSVDPTVGSHTLVAIQEGVESLPVTFVVSPAGTGQPAVFCAFGPGGALTATSDTELDGLEVYRLLDPDDGFMSMLEGELSLPGRCNDLPGVATPPGKEYYFDPIDSCLGLGCDSMSVSSLPPGTYTLDQRASDSDETPGLNYEWHSWVFTVPEAPTIATAASTANSVILSGAATPSDGVRVVRPDGSTLCTTTATGAGTWACQFPKSSTTAARAISVNPPSGAMSAYSAARSIPVLLPITETAPVAPEQITLVSWFLEFGGNLKDLKPGDRFTLNVSGMPEGTEIEVWMHSTPRLLGTATGTGLPMKLTFTVPADIESGEHEIKMIAVTPLGTQYFFTSEATVVGGVEPEKIGDKDEESSGGPGGPGGSGNRADPAAPSALSDGLAPLSAIVENPLTLVIAGGLALAILFLVALPTELLNAALSSNTSRLGRAYTAVDGALTRANDWFVRVTRSRAIAALILTTIVAIIFGFVDPNFGFDLVSLRLVLSLGIAFFLLSYVASWISGMIIHRAWGAMGVISMQPSIILFAIVGVILARLLDFSPGFLVGIAIGLELLQATKTVSARAVFVQLGVVTGLALAAWVVYSLFTPGDDFVGMLVDDTMVAVTAEGLTGALVAVFPLRFLDGRELWDVSKRLWAAAFLLVATAFALLVLPTAVEGTDVRDYGLWLLVFGVFGAVTVAIWFLFARADAREQKALSETVDA